MEMDVGERIRVAMLMLMLMLMLTLRRYLQVPYQLLQQPHFGSTYMYMYPCQPARQGGVTGHLVFCQPWDGMEWGIAGTWQYSYLVGSQ